MASLSGALETAKILSVVNQLCSPIVTDEDVTKYVAEFTNIYSQVSTLNELKQITYIQDFEQQVQIDSINSIYIPYDIKGVIYLNTVERYFSLAGKNCKYLDWHETRWQSLEFINGYYDKNHQNLDLLTATRILEYYYSLNITKGFFTDKRLETVIDESLSHSVKIINQLDSMLDPRYGHTTGNYHSYTFGLENLDKETRDAIIKEQEYIMEEVNKNYLYYKPRVALSSFLKYGLFSEVARDIGRIKDQEKREELLEIVKTYLMQINNEEYRSLALEMIESDYAVALKRWRGY